MTPRGELVKSAKIRLGILIQEHREDMLRYGRLGQSLTKPTAHDAIESVVDDCKRYGAGTLGAEILDYYRTASERAIERLINEVGQR